MTHQNYTPEEKALKQELENLAQFIEPDVDFVATLETQLIKNESLQSVETIKPPVQAKPIWHFQWLPNWAWTFSLVLLVAGAAMFFVLFNSQRDTASNVYGFLDSGQWNATPETITIVETVEVMKYVEVEKEVEKIVEVEVIVEKEVEVVGQMTSDGGGYRIMPILPIPDSNVSSNLSNNNQAAQGSNAVPIATPTPVPPADMFFADYGVNPFLDTQDEHLSTFAMDVDTASYTLARSYLMDVGQLPPAAAIRVEEFVNYIKAGYAGPSDDKAFAIHLDAAPAPFGFEEHQLLRVGLQGLYIPPQERDPALLTFVIDISGSMDQGNRLGLVKESLALLVESLNEADRIAIVVYSDNSRVVLNPTSAANKQTIMTAINNLQTEGSTNVDAGLRLGYQLATEHKRAAEINRVIVLSDGVANVDVTSPEGILSNIQGGVDNGVTLTTIGFGMGNYNDVLMEQLANSGNGNYYYVDNIGQARRIFIHNLTSLLQVIGYDAKIQVDFNPAVTDRFRLLGYENRAIANEDFRNDTVDAGEVGAGHSVTALYEVALKKAALKKAALKETALKEADLAPADVIATVYIRYQDADSREVVEVSRNITMGDLLTDINEAPIAFRLQAAAAELAELLGQSYWAQDGSYSKLLNFALALENEQPNNAQITELIELIFLAKRYQ